MESVERSKVVPGSKGAVVVDEVPGEGLVGRGQDFSYLN